MQAFWGCLYFCVCVSIFLFFFLFFIPQLQRSCPKPKAKSQLLNQLSRPGIPGNWSSNTVVVAMVFPFSNARFFV